MIETQPPSAAQIAANRENAKCSTGPVSSEGRAASSRNRRSHGLAGRAFFFLDFENADQYRELAASIYAEYDPQTDSEQRLADAMIQHHWLKQRAIGLQEVLVLHSPTPLDIDSNKLSLFLRYQTTHERSYYKAEKELRNLQKTKQKEEIGFESQKRTVESHQANVRLANARAHSLEVDAAGRNAMDVSAATPFTFEELTAALSRTLVTLVQDKEQPAAA
jgi:hypothetical protein